MKKILVLSTLGLLCGCYTSVPPAQDVYVESYTPPTVYYTYPDYAPQTTYIIEQATPDVVYVEQAPAYVYVDNPLIYGRPSHHYHHVAPKPHHHTAPKPHHNVSKTHHGKAPAKQHHNPSSHNQHHDKPVHLVK